MKSSLCLSCPFLLRSCKAQLCTWDCKSLIPCGLHRSLSFANRRFASFANQRFAFFANRRDCKAPSDELRFPSDRRFAYPEGIANRRFARRRALQYGGLGTALLWTSFANPMGYVRQSATLNPLRDTYFFFCNTSLASPVLFYAKLFPLKNTHLQEDVSLSNPKESGAPWDSCKSPVRRDCKSLIPCGLHRSSSEGALQSLRFAKHANLWFAKHANLWFAKHANL